MVGDSRRGHAFLSYVREDGTKADRLQRILENAGVPVWRDTESLWPGDDWKLRIREAITRNSLAFIACFSSKSASRPVSYQNEELLLAIEQLRQRPPTTPWLIPVRFDECEVPEFDLGAGRTLASLQRVDLIGDDWDPGAARLVAGVIRILGHSPDTFDSLPAPAGPPASPRLAVATMKQALSGTTVAVLAHDAIRSELARVRSLEILRAEPTKHGNDQIDVVEQFMAEVRVLAALIATAAYWGTDASDRWWLGDIARLARPPQFSGSLAVLDRPRLPALVMAWASGLAAIAHERGDLLTKLFSLVAVRNYREEEVTPLLVVTPECLHVADALAHLYRLFRPLFVDDLALGLDAYLDAWDRWQYLLLLAAWDIRSRRNVFVPMDSSGIRVDGFRPVLPVPHGWISSELSRLGAQHPLLVAGFFDGVPDKMAAANGTVAKEVAASAERADLRLLPPDGGTLPSGLHYPGAFTDDADSKFGIG